MHEEERLLWPDRPSTSSGTNHEDANVHQEHVYPREEPEGIRLVPVVLSIRAITVLMEYVR